MNLKALQKRNFFWHKDSIALATYFHVISKAISNCYIIPSKKKITGSSQMFPVVISSMEDFSDDEGL